MLRLRAFALGFAICGAASCNSGEIIQPTQPVNGPPAVPATVTISVDESRAAALLERDTITATALVRDAAGNAVTSGSIVWSVPFGATITPTGPRTALVSISYFGTATIVATIGGASGRLALAVRQTVTISVDESRSATLLEEDTITVTALVRDAAGSAVTTGSIVWVAPFEATVTPTGSRTALVSISFSGSFSSSVTTTILATIGGVSGSLALTARRRPEQAFIWTRESGLTVMPVPAGTVSTIPSAINDRGDVVGTMTFTENGRLQSHAFIWSASNGLRDLGTFAGTSRSFVSAATAVNVQGQVVGSTQPPGGGFSRAFRWSEESGMVELTSEEGDFDAVGINASGSIAVTRGSAGRPYYRAFRWTSAGGFETLGVDTNKYPDGAAAHAINDAGQIVGWVIWAWDNDGIAGSFWNPDGERLDVPDPWPTAINNQGQVTGGYGTAFRWTRAGGITQFPASAGASFSRGAGINDAGDVAGQMNVGGSRYLRGFVWAQSGAVTDLGLLPGALETVATAINNSGQVVGYSR